MKKIISVIVIALMAIQTNAQQIDAVGNKIAIPQTTKQNTENAKVDCANNNGIAITVSGTTTSSYSTPNATTGCSMPVVAFAGAGSWTGLAATGFLIYTFNKPIRCATVTYSAVNGPNGSGTDVGQITVDGGGTLSLSNACGASVSGNILTCNIAGTGNPYGNVSVKVSSTIPFTTIKLLNTGGKSGWVQGNPCNFILNECVLTLRSTCCPPFDKTILEKSLKIEQSGGITSPYTVKFQTSASVCNQMQAYINYYNLLNPTCNKLVMQIMADPSIGPGLPNTGTRISNNWYIFTAGSASTTCGEINLSQSWTTSGWDNPAQTPLFELNKWYKITTWMSFEPEGCNMNTECRGADRWIRVNSVSAKMANGTSGTATLEISDGKKIIQTTNLQ
jgi:hypothetical protein